MLLKVERRNNNENTTSMVEVTHPVRWRDRWRGRSINSIRFFWNLMISLNYTDSKRDFVIHHNFSYIAHFVNVYLKINIHEK